MRQALLVSGLCAFLTGGVAAQEMRPQEQSRLDRFERIAGEALMEAMSGGAAQDIAALVEALSGTPQVAFDPGMSGDWQCRTMKLGGLSPLVVYTNFDCRIEVDETGLRFEKRSGSQRTRGRIELHDGRAVYLGVGFVATQIPQSYGKLAPDFEGTGTLYPDVGVFQRVSNSRARLMIPAPVNESDFDILELRR